MLINVSYIFEQAVLHYENTMGTRMLQTWRQRTRIKQLMEEKEVICFAD